MYVIVLILISAGTHKIASDQVLYPNSESCEVSRIMITESLVRTMPTADGAVLSKCTRFSLQDRAKEKL